PPGDYDDLYAAGVTGVFGPGTVIAEAAQQLLRVLLDEVEPRPDLQPAN
ncbi:MAG: hypothetical protein GVY12_16420, partial [Bacteroidetes bacterium]|nr:hypothetical protein [Bacteroidota bacterium]